MKKILIAGYYGHFNAGDEAILAGMLRDLRAHADLQVLVVSSRPEATERQHGVSAIAAGELDDLIAAVEDSDLVILGGGGIFHDYWQVREEALLTPSLGGLPYYVSFPVLAALTGTPAAIHGVGVGPVTTEAGRRLVRIAFELCDHASVRDLPSAELLADIGVDRRRVRVRADPAFAFESASPGDAVRVLDRLGIPRNAPLLTVCLRYWDFEVDPSRWEREVAAGLDRLLAERPGFVVFLPFHLESGTVYGDDLAVSQRVAGAMTASDRVVVAESSFPPDVLAAILGQSEAVLAMRLHAALFAMKQGVPVVGLGYDPKLSAAFSAAGLSDLVVPIGEWSAETISTMMHRALDHGEGERTAVHAHARRQRDLCRQDVEEALELLHRPRAPRTESREVLDQLTLGKAVTAARLMRRIAGLQQQLAREKRTREVLDHESRAALAAVQEETSAEREKLLEDFQQERIALSSEVRTLATRLDMLESSLSLALVFRLWRVLARIVPAGSKRWRLYSVFRGGLERVLLFRRRRRYAAMPPRAGGATEAASKAIVKAALAETAPDFGGDLDRFTERIASDSSSLFLIVSGTRLEESEGQRPMQIARELAERRLPVIFVYWRWSSSEWSPQDRLDQGILQLPFDYVVEHPQVLTRGIHRATDLRLALFEFPHPGLFRLVAELNAAGWITMYDVLDDWREFHVVGQAPWYDEEFERHLITAADAVVAVSEPLADRVRELGGEAVELVPNGLRAGLEEIRVPVLLERGEITVGYFGYLASAWFDWELVAEVARRNSKWRFYLIGYGGSPDSVRVPDNVELLGKRPQIELSGYAAHWDVAIIPFKPSILAAGADPIKTYEYLAMGLPVVAAGVNPPPGGENLVQRADGLEPFAEAIRAAAAEDPSRVAARREFALRCTWSKRLDTILETVAESRQRVGEKTEMFAGT